SKAMKSTRLPCPHRLMVYFAIGLLRFSALGQSTEIVFKDTFELSPGSSDINEGIGTPRTSGSFPGTTYVEGENTAAGGADDDLTQVSPSDSAGKLLIVNQGNGVSPNHNFLEGPNFTIEADIFPGANLSARDSTDWAAIVFGSSTMNAYVNASDGFGVLFRVNGAIEVWDGTTRVYGSPEALLPTGFLSVKL